MFFNSYSVLDDTHRGIERAETEPWLSSSFTSKKLTADIHYDRHDMKMECVCECYESGIVSRRRGAVAENNFNKD